jgi:hypothetical protein
MCKCDAEPSYREPIPLEMRCADSGKGDGDVPYTGASLRSSTREASLGAMSGSDEARCSYACLYKH